MSFGPRKPATGPPRPTRPTLVKKPVSKAPATTRSDARPTQPPAKPKAPPEAVPLTKKATPVAPKKSVPKPPSPEPVYDYESDFESDESVPSGDSSSSEQPVDNTDSAGFTSEGGDDENEENGDDLEENEEERIGQEHAKPKAEAIVGAASQMEDVKHEQQKQQHINPRNARSVDILSKISLNDVTVELYQFDPEEYAELRTNFGVTATVAHGKHIQTDSSLVSTAQQTSRVVTRDRYTSMHGVLRSWQADDSEEESLIHQGNDEEEVQNYSSLQNIERMFTTLNGALERQFSNDASMFHELKTGPRRGRTVNHQRSILELVRRSAPIFEALLQAKRVKSRKTEPGGNGTDGRPDETPEDRTVSTNVIRSFDTGKMCPEYEVKMLQAKDLDQGQALTDRFVIEFWARGIYSRPMYRFSSWSSVKCVDYECRRQMMVFGGTGDGTLQMWLGDAGRCYNEILPPHQIVAPNVGRKQKLACWEIVTVKVLPVAVTRDSATIDTGNESVLNQVFGLYSTGIIVVWQVQMDAAGSSSTSSALNARLGRPDVTLVQSKVIDLNTRIGNRLTYDALRSFGNLLLHDHHQMVLSTDRSVIRLSHFVESEYDPALLIQPDPAHSIVNLKRMAQTTDTLFALYSNKTVRVLKLNTAPDGTDGARHRHRKHDNQPSLMLSVCTNKSCTIQSIVHEEAKRYGSTNSASGGRADGGSVAPRASELEKYHGVMLFSPRFHHGQQILFFGNSYPDGLLSEQNFNEKSVALTTSYVKYNQGTNILPPNSKHIISRDGNIYRCIGKSVPSVRKLMGFSSVAITFAICMIVLGDL